LLARLISETAKPVFHDDNRMTGYTTHVRSANPGRRKEHRHVRPPARRRRQKPAKPSPSFPLTPHNNGQWCKKPAARCTSSAPGKTPRPLSKGTYVQPQTSTPTTATDYIRWGGHGQASMQPLLYRAVPDGARLEGLFGGVFVGERGWVTRRAKCYTQSQTALTNPTAPHEPLRGGSPYPPRKKRVYWPGNGACAAGAETRRAKWRCRATQSVFSVSASNVARLACPAVAKAADAPPRLRLVQPWSSARKHGCKLRSRGTRNSHSSR
jgi:hypothetical protein